MSIVRKDSPDDAPPEVQTLMAGARKGELESMEFCKKLEDHGIVGFEKLPFLLKAYNLKFEDAKEILIKFHCGSVDRWAEDIIEVVDQLSKEDIEKSDGR